MSTSDEPPKSRSYLLAALWAASALALWCALLFVMLFVVPRFEKEALDQLQPPERNWSQERVFAVRLRVPTGAEQLEALGLSAEETARVVQRAVSRAYPFLEREGVRPRLHRACTSTPSRTRAARD